VVSNHKPLKADLFLFLLRDPTTANDKILKPKTTTAGALDLRNKFLILLFFYFAKEGNTIPRSVMSQGCLVLLMVLDKKDHWMQF